MRSLTVTLPDDLVEQIEARVAAGEYASASELVRDSLGWSAEPPFDLDEHEVARIRASFDAIQADPSRTIPIEQVIDRVRRRVLGPD